MKAKTVNISLPTELLQKVDQAAKAEYATRSDYIRASLVARLRENQLDLRDEHGNGMDVATFLEIAREVLVEKTGERQDSKILKKT
jgi:metal-responsive CopG/Arc/MetJ family transcriptional regulator